MQASSSFRGTTRLVVNVYRGWVGENAIRDLRRHILAYLRVARLAAPGPEARGVGAAMLVGEVEPIGGFVGSSFSEPLLQGGILLSVLAYIVHLDRWMAAAAFALFLPQLVFVPLMQSAINRRAGARVWVLRQLGVSTVDTHAASVERDMSDGKRIDRMLQLNMGIYKLKFSNEFPDELLQPSPSCRSTANRRMHGAYRAARGWRHRRLHLRRRTAERSVGRSGQLLPRLEPDPREIQPGRRQGKPALRALALCSDRSEDRIPSGGLTYRQGKCQFVISTSCSGRALSR